MKEDEVEIKNVGVWGLSNQIIEKFFVNRIIFAGDSAHSFPPAGGFGMNTGICDVNNLVHKLLMINKGNHIQILEKYSQERRYYALMISNLAIKYYNKSMEIPRNLGMNVDNLLLIKNGLDSLSSVIST